MNSSITTLLRTAALSLAVGSLSVGYAAVVVNPTLATGATSIDPAGSETVDTTVGTLTTAQLTSRIDYAGALQNLGAGFTGTNAGGVNFIQFTDANTQIANANSKLADIRITVTAAGNAPSGIDINDPSRVTSGSSGLRQVSAGSILFEFGSFSAADGSDFILGTGINAVGFTIGNNRSTMSYSIQYRNSVGGILSTQAFPGGTEAVTPGSGGSASSDGLEGFTSYASTADTAAARIASVLVTRTGGSNISSTIDDLGFTIIPEPTTLAMLLGGLGVLVLRRRRS